MSNPMLATTNSNLDIRVKEPSDGAPPTSGVGPGSSDCFKTIIFSVYLFEMVFKNKKQPKIHY